MDKEENFDRTVSIDFASLFIEVTIELKSMIFVIFSRKFVDIQ